MKTRSKTRSMIMINPHTLRLSLEVLIDKPLNQRPARIYHKSIQDQQKEKLLFKLIKNNFPSNRTFSPYKETNSDPFRLPTKTRERKQNKCIDIEFKEIPSKMPEGIDRVLFPVNNDSSKKLFSDKIHYVRQFKARVIMKRQRRSEIIDPALVIRKKKIVPVISSRFQFNA